MYQKYKIQDAAQIFNLDEIVFSVRHAIRSRMKALNQRGATRNALELRWSGNADQLKIMPVVSADGQVYNTVVVLHGKQAKWKKRDGGKLETLSQLFPCNAILYYRE